MRTLTQRVLAPVELGRAGGAAFLLAAVGVAVAGYLHGKLFHQGYGDVPVVGPLFFLNVVGSAAAVLMLLARRVLLFAMTALGISAGAIVSIYISHSSSFFRFSEEGYSPQAQAIMIAEAAALVLTLLGLALSRRRLVGA